MKRPQSSSSDPPSKKPTPSPPPPSSAVSAVFSDDNLLHEILKHADARTLALSACVSPQWRVTARDERLWELICTRHWAHMGCPKTQLRTVVLALGGFRRLHSLYLVPLSRPAATSSSGSTWQCGPGRTRWGKDEVQLSLSLLSIRYFEKMGFGGGGKGV